MCRHACGKESSGTFVWSSETKAGHFGFVVVCCTSAESNTGTVSHESVKSVVFRCANKMQMHQHRKGAKTHAVSYLIFHIVCIFCEIFRD